MSGLKLASCIAAGWRGREYSAGEVQRLVADGERRYKRCAKWANLAMKTQLRGIMEGVKVKRGCLGSCIIECLLHSLSLLSLPKYAVQMRLLRSCLGSV